MSNCRHVVSHIRNPEQNALSLRCRHCGDTVTVLVDNRPGELLPDGGTRKRRYRDTDSDRSSNVSLDEVGDESSCR